MLITPEDGGGAPAMSLAESSVAMLRYTDGVAVDDETVAASVNVLRRDPRVRRIVLLTETENALAAADVDVCTVLPGTTSSEVIAALSKPVPERRRIHPTGSIR